MRNLWKVPVFYGTNNAHRVPGTSLGDMDKFPSKAAWKIVTFFPRTHITVSVWLEWCQASIHAIRFEGAGTFRIVSPTTEQHGVEFQEQSATSWALWLREETRFERTIRKHCAWNYDRGSQFYCGPFSPTDSFRMWVTAENLLFRGASYKLLWRPGNWILAETKIKG